MPPPQRTPALHAIDGSSIAVPHTPLLPVGYVHCMPAQDGAKGIQGPGVRVPLTYVHDVPVSFLLVASRDARTMPPDDAPRPRPPETRGHTVRIIIIVIMWCVLLAWCSASKLFAPLSSLHSTRLPARAFCKPKAAGALDRCYRYSASGRGGGGMEDTVKASTSGRLLSSAPFFARRFAGRG